MIPQLYTLVWFADDPVFERYAYLSDCLSCVVTEERNGIYELEMQYPADGLESLEITTLRIIEASTPDTELTGETDWFRIYKVVKESSGINTVYARHISYDLDWYDARTDFHGAPAQSLTAALKKLENATKADQTRRPSFTFTSDFTSAKAFNVDYPSPVRSWLFGQEGSMIDVYGGEWRFHRFSAELLRERGADRGVAIRRGKNVKDFRTERDASNMYHDVTVYWRDPETGNVEREIANNYVPGSEFMSIKRTKFLDASDQFSSIPDWDDLGNYADSYIKNNDLGRQNSVYDISFEQVDTLDKIHLCDTVYVSLNQYPAYDFSAKCLALEWDVLRERVKSVRLGTAKTLAKTISDTQKTANASLASKRYRST